MPENKLFARLALPVLLALSLAQARAETMEGPDQRFPLDLTPAEQAQFLGEMRQMLASVQGIIAGIGAQDRQKIAASARYSGNRMARATPEPVRQKLPQRFKELGGPTHMLFEELIVRAETDEMDMLTIATGELMQQCLACHALFRVH